LKQENKRFLKRAYSNTKGKKKEIRNEKNPDYVQVHFFGSPDPFYFDHKLQNSALLYTVQI